MIPIIGAMLLILIIGLVATIALDERHSRAIATAASLVVLVIVISVLFNSLLTGNIVHSEQYAYYLPSLNVAFEMQFTTRS